MRLVGVGEINKDRVVVERGRKMKKEEERMIKESCYCSNYSRHSDILIIIRASLVNVLIANTWAITYLDASFTSLVYLYEFREAYIVFGIRFE